MHCQCCEAEMEQVMPDIYWCPECQWQHYTIALPEVTQTRLTQHKASCQRGERDAGNPEMHQS